MKSGLKQTFVQIAFPADKAAATFGRVYVKTYWKYFDRKQGYAKNVQPHTLRNLNDGKPWPINNYTLDQNADGFKATDLTDLGNGQMLINLSNHFIGGTYVRIGASILADGNPAFKSTDQGIQFVAPIIDLATKDVFLVSRDGTEHQIKLDHDPKNTLYKRQLPKPELTFTPVDDINTQITATFCYIDPLNDDVPLVMTLAGKVYGYADAPIRRNGNTLSVTVPTSVLLNTPDIVFKSVLVSDAYWKQARFPALRYPQGSQLPKLVLMEQSDDTAKYLLYGAGLDTGAVLTLPKEKVEVLGEDKGDRTSFLGPSLELVFGWFRW